MTLHNAAIAALRAEIKECENTSMIALHRRDALMSQLIALLNEQAVAEENARAAQTPIDFAYPRMRGAQ